MENVNVDERYFDLGTILSVTSGYLFTDIGNIYDILSYITSTHVNVYNMLYSLRVTEFCILQRYPQLKGIGKDISVLNENDSVTFVNYQKTIFGESLALTPISKERNNSLECNGR